MSDALLLCDECRQYYRDKPADIPGIHDGDLLPWPDDETMKRGHVGWCIHASGPREDDSRAFKYYKVVG